MSSKPWEVHLDATLELTLERPPYMTKTGDHETYIFDLAGTYLAKLYDDQGESILQQNVRMFEGDKGTNLAIAKTATSVSEAKDFSISTTAFLLFAILPHFNHLIIN